MTISADSLRELHRIHRQLKDLRDRLDRGPKQTTAADANVKKMETELEQAKDATKKTKIAADQKQLQLRSREDKIKELGGKLNQASSNREYQSLKEQIAADEQANSVLADEILEALEKMDQLAAVVKTAEANLKKAREEGTKIKQRVDDEKGTLESELARVQAALLEAESNLHIDFKRDYERIARARGEDALAQVEGENCGHCFQKLTAQTIENLLQSRPVFCKSCGCLLYLPEDRSPKAKS